MEQDDSNTSETELLHCKECQGALLYQRYVVREEAPHCVPCFEKHFANRCYKCHDPISINCKELLHCKECQGALLYQRYVVREEAPHCVPCFEKHFANRCYKCHDPISINCKELLHCKECPGALLYQRYVVREEAPHCVPCFEKHFANRCYKCHDPISINCKELLHCKECQGALLYQRYVVREEAPHCVPCFEKHFANRCYKCHDPISINCKELLHCKECQGALLYQRYVVREEAPHCVPCLQKHFANRCYKCHDPININCKEDTNTSETELLHCKECQGALLYQRYVVGEEAPHCVPCLQKHFANRCYKCHDPININCKEDTNTSETELLHCKECQDLTYQDKHWHEYCFICTDCKTSLADSNFGMNDDRVFCPDCHDQNFAAKCDGCHRIFKAGTKKLEFNGKGWHEHCFRCSVCNSIIGNGNFAPKNDVAYCPKCYEKTFATHCSKCNKPIIGEGVCFKDKPLHKQCFECTNCKSCIAGQKFTVKEDEPYCTPCFAELFAKRCQACTKPVIRVGNVKAVTFEGRQWHADCFICAGCKISMVGKGFITDESGVYCPACAQAKVATDVHTDD